AANSKHAHIVRLIGDLLSVALYVVRCRQAGGMYPHRPNRAALPRAGELAPGAAGYNGAMRPEFTWRLRERELKLGERTVVMGVLNVTPDSFSEAGLHFSPPAAVEHGLRLLEEGADILDIGGESTRPGAKVGDKGVSAEEELRRILPVID